VEKKGGKKPNQKVRTEKSAWRGKDTSVFWGVNGEKKHGDAKMAGQLAVHSRKRIKRVRSFPERKSREKNTNHHPPSSSSVKRKAKAYKKGRLGDLILRNGRVQEEKNKLTARNNGTSSRSKKTIQRKPEGAEKA